jgi:hypothetical protein
LAVVDQRDDLSEIAAILDIRMRALNALRTKATFHSSTRPNAHYGDDKPSSDTAWDTYLNGLYLDNAVMLGGIFARIGKTRRDAEMYTVKV